MPPREWFEKYGGVDFKERHPEGPWGWSAKPGDGLWYGKYGFCPWELFERLRGYTSANEYDPDNWLACKGYPTKELAYEAMLTAIEEIEKTNGDERLCKI